jgi:hypothetical protein
MAIMRWVRLISLARMLNGRQRRYNGWQKWMYSRLALSTLRKRFIEASTAELNAMRRLPPDVFDDAVRRDDAPSCEVKMPLRTASASI